MPTETVLLNVQLAVATFPDGRKALAFADAQSGNSWLVPMSDDNFRSLSAQWSGLVLAGSMPAAGNGPAMAPSIKQR